MSINGWMDKKMWYIDTTDYYLPVKKNEVMKHEGNWLKLENSGYRTMDWTREDKCPGLLHTQISASNLLFSMLVSGSQATRDRPLGGHLEKACDG